MELIEALDNAGAHFIQLAETVGERGGEPSAIEGWSIDDLLAHVVAGCRMSNALMDGASAVEADDVRRSPVGQPIVAALVDAVGSQFNALAVDDQGLEVVHHPIIDMTPQLLTEIRLVEFVVHRWDLARSMRTDDAVDPGHAELAWAAMEPLAEVAGTLGVFGDGPSGTLDESNTAAERLLDLTGRRP